MIRKFTPFSFLPLLFSTFEFAAAKPGDIAPVRITEHINNGQTLDIANYKNKVIYVDFWASWCPPCKLSFPSLNKLHNELYKQDFEVIAINLDEDKNDALEFLQHNPVKFTVAYDSEGKCPSGYNVMAMPTSYIIDKQEIVREVHLGFKEDSINKIRKTVLALLAE